MRGVRELEFVVGLGFLVSPMIYAMTLTPGPIQECEPELATAVAASTTPPLVCEAPLVDEAPAFETPTGPTFAPVPFLFVASGRVLLQQEVPADWGRGELYEPAGEPTYRAAKPANLDRLPGDLVARIGQPIDLHGAAGKLCTAKVERLTVVAQYDGWGLGEVLAGNDEYEEYEYDEYGRPLGIDPATVREAVWRTQPKWLVAELDQDCGTKRAPVLWARDPQLPVPTILTKSKASTDLTKARVREFRRSSAYTDLRAQYEAYYAELDESGREYTPAWETFAKQHRARASSWIDADEQTQLIEIHFGFTDSSCGDGIHAVLDRVEVLRVDDSGRAPDGAGDWVGTEHAVDPIAVFDADLDGRFELLYEFGDDGWTRRLESASSELDQWAVVSQDWYCPC